MTKFVVRATERKDSGSAMHAKQRGWYLLRRLTGGNIELLIGPLPTRKAVYDAYVEMPNCTPFGQFPYGTSIERLTAYEFRMNAHCFVDRRPEFT